MASITITLIDLDGGHVSVRTDANRPQIGTGVTPAQGLAMELLGTSFKRGAEVLYDAQSVPAIALALELLDAEGFAHSVPLEVRDRARRALGREKIDRTPTDGVDIDRIHRTRARQA
ncbi:hypothetical protein [Variovorax sp. 3P27G3]|jgi:hypothetical protein|uniref:hypothetical protein n=1 Tax=Variovorax sp. 3P27G3 TaxID=2502214 RepID=UPI0010F61BD8|nr:hypothetical protein [Variovorax sp. 3P27G3]